MVFRGSLHIAFTGTQEELTRVQKLSLHYAFVGMKEDNYQITVHHGDCIGADSCFHTIAYYAQARIEIHPTNIPGKRAYCYERLHRMTTVVHPVKDPLVRNQIMIHSGRFLIAAPEGPEKLRSGTWSTIRFAIKMGKPVFIVWPNGELEER